MHAGRRLAVVILPRAEQPRVVEGVGALLEWLDTETVENC